MESNSLTDKSSKVKCLFGHHRFDDVWKLDAVREIRVCSTCEAAVRLVSYVLSPGPSTFKGKVLAADNKGIVVVVESGTEYSLQRLEWEVVKNGRTLYVLTGRVG